MISRESMIRNTAADFGSSGKKVAKKLKKTADKYVHLFGWPHPRHWALFPGGVRVCFTKNPCEDGMWYFLSVSARSGRVSDSVIFNLLKLFDAPGDGVEEIPARIDPSVRIFTWKAEVPEAGRLRTATAREIYSFVKAMESQTLN
ncbi:hypothetical protein [Desulfofundulus sp.]|uniref:hypothetical protein n=1 Tax=Desulfofundulus sp. TaxID=2282750 RepID=UPI003C74F539